MSLKNILPKRKIVETFEKKYTAWESEGFPGCDQKMMNILPYFNAFDGIATIHCCEGHSRKKQIPYIVFMVTHNEYFKTVTPDVGYILRSLMDEGYKINKMYVDK